MITLFTFGIDPYSLRQLSADITPKLSQLFECKREDINFYATEGLFVHDGVEQNTWYILVKVMLPRKLQIFQKEAASIIANFYKNVVINLEIIFEYYLSDEREVFINHDYPLYLDENNMVEASDETIGDDDIEDIYTGDAFENYRDKFEG